MQLHFTQLGNLIYDHVVAVGLKSIDEMQMCVCVQYTNLVLDNFLDVCAIFGAARRKPKAPSIFSDPNWFRRPVLLQFRKTVTSFIRVLV